MAKAAQAKRVRRTAAAAAMLRPNLLRGVSRGARRSLVSPAAAAANGTGDPYVWSHTPTEVTRLPNGMRVASQNTFDETATVGIWIDAGSRFETRENNGTAHFLEHMAFKGTRRRTRLALEKEIENMGGHLNAYTSREETVYYAKCFRDDIEQGVDILADILQHSTLDLRHVNYERGVILREMVEVEKTVEEVILDRLHLTAFNESSLGFTILGPVENIQSITQGQLREYMCKNYTSDRMVLAAAGPVDHESLVRFAQDKFGDLPHSGTVQGNGQAQPQFCGAELLYCSDAPVPGELVHFAVGYEGVPWTHPDSLTFMVMQSTIGRFQRGQGPVPPELSGNRLTTSIASNLFYGELESFSAFNTCYKDTGLFGFYARCMEGATAACLDELLNGVSHLAHTVTEEEVERGKRQLKTTLFGGLDSTTAIAEDIGRQLLVYGRRIPTSELLFRIDAIDAAEVRRVAQKRLLDAEIAVTALGPLSDMPPLDELRRKTSTFRL